MEGCQSYLSQGLFQFFTWNMKKALISQGLQVLLLIILVPEAGIEPARGHPRWILSPVRLPISPLRQSVFYLYFIMAEVVKNKADQQSLKNLLTHPK